MTLKKYNAKRDFKNTLEPKGRALKRKKPKLLYVIQKHAASHLHYDFRLELNGVLISFAVPKGPCLDPTVKRLAVQVEDHPIAYASFEGTIPKGQYGAGTVMLWDKGEWIPEDKNPTAAYKKGVLTFTLKAEKLSGKWKLIRIKKDDKTWLLIKVKDEAAKPYPEYDITKTAPLSVASGRDIVSSFTTSATKPKHEKHVQATLTHPDKLLYPEDNITKLDVANYYQYIAKWMLPYIKNRLITLVRCPTDYHQSFYQKHDDTHRKSSALKKISVQEKKSAEYLYIKDAKGLLELAQMSVLEIHPWQSKMNKLENPDMLVFDIDPDTNIPWKKVVAAAYDIKNQLAKYKLQSFVKTTGGKGLHVVAPIKPEYDWQTVKNFAKSFVETMATNNPKQYVTKISKRVRQGKIFLDYLRNQRGATAVAPYSLRARIHAPVATPLAWNELTDNIQDTAFTIKTIMKRLDNLKKDPWQDFFKIKQSLRL